MYFEGIIKMGFLQYVLGPKLYMIYGTSNGQKIYEPGGLEKLGDQVLTTLNLIWNIGFYTSPLLLAFLYKRSYFVFDSISSVAKISASISVLIIISMIMRGLGRAQSPTYAKLIKAMELLNSPQTAAEGRRALRLFDFEFTYWLVDFNVKNIPSDEKKLDCKHTNPRKATRTFRLSTLPCEIAAYLAIHTFGIRMIYPGSLKLLQSYMKPMLISGRAKLIEDQSGQRFKVRTVDSNDIDTIFMDNRHNGNNGKTLVICSEGNAGFYEIGIIGTPLALKYSVLGWNHPGFGGSTGHPYPDQDKNAIDAIIQFAIYHLNFSVDDILLYGWSIGGFNTLWAATCYPDVKGVILDATFDDILYLAQSRMPQSLAGIVRIAIRNYCNLHNIELAQNYNGPISLIRRTEDEIIAEDNNIETNRGNYLLLGILKYRYPYIFQAEQLSRCRLLLAKPLDHKNYTSAEDDLCLARLITYVSDRGKKFPLDIGKDYTGDVRHQMADFLVRKHFFDYKSTHCTPLPVEYFNIPWDIPVEQGFVLT